MPRPSVLSGMQRQVALPRGCCAHFALTLLVGLATSIASAQSPALQPPTFSSGQTAASKPLPPPERAAGPNGIIAPTSPQSKSSVLQVPTEHSNQVGSDPAPVPPQQPKTKVSQPAKPSEDLATALERPGDLNLHGLSLEAALFTISEQWNINIVSGDVKGTVNGVFKQAPLREILDAILLSNGYNYRAVGKSLVISSVEQLGQINPFFQSAIISVQSADIDEVVSGAQLLKTPKGEVRALKSAHSIVVLDFPDRVKMIREFVATVDGAGSGRFASPDSRNGMPLEVGYFRTQHISAKTAEAALQGVLSKAGKVAIMEKEDRLLVTDFSDNLAMVEKVLASVDHERPQVRITALMYDLSLRDIEKLGINWNHAIKTNLDASGTPQHKFAVDSLMQVPFQSGAAGSTLTFMNLSRHFDITAVAVALQGASDSRLLADPNVAVLENEDAIIEKVSEIPYQQLTQTQQGGNIGTTSFKKAGITLHVTPKIAADGTIRMIVHPEVSRLTGFTPGDNQPIIDISSTTTVLSVGNRQTVVIGGLRQRSDVGDFNGVPYLKDLKVVGRLFRSRDTDVRESELVVFISPEIISYSDEPTCRQKLVNDTIRCRLDQLPEAEGCPPCCRRLPLGAVDLPGPASDSENQPTPVNGQDESSNLLDSTSSKQPDVSEPLSNARMPSTELQFVVAGQHDRIPEMLNVRQLRRLPSVVSGDATLATEAPVNSGLFSAPPALVPTASPASESQFRTADRDLSQPALR
jgi:general secretion pathway protein D